MERGARGELPTLEKVLTVARILSIPQQEAEEFFYHYDALGWMKNDLPILHWDSLLKLWHSREPRMNNSSNGSKAGGRTIQDMKHEIGDQLDAQGFTFDGD